MLMQQHDDTIASWRDGTNTAQRNMHVEVVVVALPLFALFALTTGAPVTRTVSLCTLTPGKGVTATVANL